MKKKKIFYKPKKKDNTIKHKINDKINYEQILLIDDNGGKLGQLSLADGLKLGEERNLDLVMVAEREIPVVKLTDYGKFIYANEKKEKNIKKNSKNIELKNINIRFCTDVHDFEVKTKMATKFLQEGNRVSFFMRFRRKEAMDEKKVKQGIDLLNEKIPETLNKFGKLEKKAEFNGKNMTLYLIPIGKKK